MALSYQTLFQLKFKEGIPTAELVKMFPEAVDRVSFVALLDIPEMTLRQIVREEKDLEHLLKLKKKYSRFF